jgi:hypothetical protein
MANIFSTRKNIQFNWGGEPNPRAIKHQMLERFKCGNKFFGQLKSLDVLWTAKKHGQAEPDTEAFLTYEDRESHWYAIALYNELLKINGIKCIFRPAAYSDNLNDEGVKVPYSLTKQEICMLNVLVIMILHGVIFVAITH